MAFSLGFITAFLAFAVLKPCFGTVDLTYAQISFVANHLSTHECHRLLASLSFPPCEVPPEEVLERRARIIGAEVPCMLGLMNWNLKEGNGSTHYLLAQRLKQLGHGDLSSELSNRVFKDLSDSLATAADESPGGLKTTTTFSGNSEGLLEDKEMIAYYLIATIGGLVVIMSVLSVAGEILSYAAYYQSQNAEQGEDEGEEEFKDERDTKLFHIYRPLSY